MNQRFANRKLWISGAVVAALVAVSLSARHRVTAGEQLLAALTAQGIKTRAALLLLDYSPDRELIAKAHKAAIVRGAGAAPGYEFQAVIPDGQRWVQCGDALLAWHADAQAARGELREAVAKAGETIQQALPHTHLDDTASQEALMQARQALAGLGDEALLLAWISADRGVLAEMNNREEAFREGMLLLARPNPGPALMFQTMRGHVYLLPEERSPGEAWCEEEAFDLAGRQVWHGVLRVKGEGAAKGGGPSAQDVRTMAVVLGEAALQPQRTPKQAPAAMPF